jgi:hypothetical protein
VKLAQIAVVCGIRTISDEYNAALFMTFRNKAQSGACSRRKSKVADSQVTVTVRLRGIGARPIGTFLAILVCG